jgi:exo-1,4-beta-D-glucosaminidase
MLVWLNGSDNPAIPAVESMYLRIEKESLWPNPILSSATGASTTITGPSGVKMTGPYDYVPPNYWLIDTKLGGAWGFNTETSPGPAIPLPTSLRKFLPSDKLWPQNEVWGFHEGGERFQTLTFYNTSLEHRYGAPKDLSDFARKAYAMDYEGERAMFEAYARNKFASTGVIQWMLNNAWPSMIWHLYDYYLRPGGGYFGAKTALQSLDPIYGYDARSISVVNSRYQDAKGLRLVTKVLNLDMTEKFSNENTIDVPADGVVKALTLPDIDGLSPTYFVALRISDSGGKLVGENF